MLLFGGVDDSGKFRNDAYLLDARRMAWMGLAGISRGAPPKPRAYHTYNALCLPFCQFPHQLLHAYCQQSFSPGRVGHFNGENCKWQAPGCALSSRKVVISVSH